jgi:hypothetical protein
MTLSDIIKVLIGGGIVLVTSLVTGYFTYLLQARKDKQNRIWEEEDKEQKRLWELEDRKYAEKKNVLKNRINQAEEITNQYFQYAQSIYDMEFNAINPQYIHAFESPDEMSTNLVTYHKNQHKLIAIFSSIGDADLMEYVVKFRTVIDKEFSNAANLGKLETKEINSDEVKIRMGKFKAEAEEYYTKIKLRLDELQVNA